MSERLAIRPRPRRSRRRVDFVSLPAMAGAAPRLDAPSLVFLDEPHRHDVLVSGGLSALLHLALFAALILAALLAPREMVERIIPVELRPQAVELPGTNLEPAPAGPKSVGAARPSAAALAAAAAPALSAEEAEALRQAALAAVRDALDAMDAPQPVTAPTQLTRNTVQADTVAARAAAAESVPTDLVAEDDLAPLDIDPADLAAIDLGDLSGPRDVDTSALDGMTAGEAFATLSQLEGRSYADAATLGEVTAGATVGGGPGGSGVDTGVASEWSGGGGSGPGIGGGGAGGEGRVQGRVACLESAFVQRYLEKLKDRAYQHWIVPDGVPPDVRVRLRFDLDDAGVASNIEALEADDAVLGHSAEVALRNAAPFPPLDDDNRCLSDDRIILNFIVGEG